MKRLIGLVLLLCVLMPVCASAEEPEYSDESVYRIYDAQGAYLTSHAGRVYEDDEYIAADNKLYIVTAVDDAHLTATANYLGIETAEERVETQTVFSAEAEATPGATEAAKQDPNTAAGGKKLIAMYSTHTDESYEPTDGTSSKMENAGILDVGQAFKKNLEEQGIEVIFSEESHLPHDAGAYRRSRQTAEELLKRQPEALIDIHRDGIPDPDEYTETIDGEKLTKVRLLVGRSNPNADSNRSFAKQIKKTADEKYPGLIKDIFIGKGNYNQELYPRSILLEFGTHTTSKERAIRSTKHMAEVLDDVLFGGAAKAEGAVAEGNQSTGKGVLWVIGGVIVAGILYALAATGTFSGMKHRLSRGASELTGGSMGRKPKDPD
jgi:stage II sporulation protein P